jgi:putative addiction module component (TIGR02574 family)
MTGQSKRILEDALTLPPTERASLVEAILSSFDFPARQGIDTLWANEVESRIDAYERGQMGSVPAREVFDRIDRQQGE